MDFILMPNTCDYQLQGFVEGTLLINQQPYQSSVLVSSTSLAAWRPQCLSDIQLSDLRALSALNADVILLGTGMQMQFLPLELQSFIRTQSLPLEVMTTSAAIRTFQVLCAEQRLVYAALLV